MKVVLIIFHAFDILLVYFNIHVWLVYSWKWQVQLFYRLSESMILPILSFSILLGLFSIVQLSCLIQRVFNQVVQIVGHNLCKILTSKSGTFHDLSFLGNSAYLWWKSSLEVEKAVLRTSGLRLCALPEFTSLHLSVFFFFLDFCLKCLPRVPVGTSALFEI